MGKSKYYDGSSFSVLDSAHADIATNATNAANSDKVDNQDAAEFVSKGTPGDFNVSFTERNNGDSGTAKTINWTLSNKQRIRLTDNATLTFTAPPGACNLLLKIVQDGTGNRSVTFPSTVKTPNGTPITLSTSANAVDILTMYYDGTSYYSMLGADFK